MVLGSKEDITIAIAYYMDLSPSATKRDVEAPFSLQDNQARNARCIAFPRINTYDIWVHGFRELALCYS